MIETELVLVVEGIPLPKGSLKCIGTQGTRRHVLVDDNPHTRKWLGTVSVAATGLDTHADARQGVGIEITSTLPRPSSHYGTGRNEGRIRPSAPDYPTAKGTGDVDKLARLVLDALQDAHVLTDDAQVVEVTSRKAYAAAPSVDVLDAPGIVVRVYPVPEDGAP